MDLGVRVIQPEGQLSSPQPELGDTARNPLSDEHPQKGKLSVIKEYCEAAIKEHGDQIHLWICIKRKGQTIAQPVLFPEDETLGIPELRKYCGWFKRYFSLYSATAVKETEIRFLKVGKSGEIEVVSRPINYEKQKAEYERRLEAAKDQEVTAWSCGVDVMGNRHDEFHHCENSVCGEDYETYCLLEHTARLTTKVDELTWLPHMLESFWQKGIQSEGKSFLQETSFLHKFSDLMYDKYFDAIEPYGKTINGFLIIEGWNLQFLLWIMMGSLLCSICIVAITTAASHSFDAGLAAGSYAVGFGATGIAVLTFLSAVL